MPGLVRTSTFPDRDLTGPEQNQKTNATEKIQKVFMIYQRRPVPFFFFFGRQMVCLRVLEYFQGAHFRAPLQGEASQSQRTRGRVPASEFLNLGGWGLVLTGELQMLIPKMGGEITTGTTTIRTIL